MEVPERSWQPAPQSVILPRGEVHVWRADLNVAPDEIRHLGETLSTDERARAERFYSPQDRNRYTVSHGILRGLLARYLASPAGDFRFCLNAYAKPALEPATDAANLRFNLSHSHQLALFAFADRREVGVDVEYIRRSVADKRLAERFFSPQEVATLRALPESAQTEAFFQCWTRKEAYIKARGEGLSINLASFAVSLAPAQLINLPITGIDDPEATRWSLRPLAPGSGYAGAVAAEGAEWPVSLWQWA